MKAISPRTIRYRLSVSITSAAWLIASITTARSQDAGSSEIAKFESNSTAGRSNIIGFERLMSSFEFWLSLTIVLFTVLILAVEFYMIFRAKHIIFKPDDVLRLVITTLVICGTLFFLAAGFSSQQIAPAVGLFGTVVGYLLGSSDRLRSRPDDGERDAKDKENKVENS